MWVVLKSVEFMSVNCVHHSQSTTLAIVKFVVKKNDMTIGFGIQRYIFKNYFVGPTNQDFPWEEWQQANKLLKY